MDAQSTNVILEHTSMYSYLLVLGCLSLLLLAAFWLKRFQRSQVDKSGKLKILQTKQLSMKHKLMLVEVNNEQILIGYTPQQIQTLHVLTREMESEPDFSKAYEHAKQDDSNE